MSQATNEAASTVDALHAKAAEEFAQWEVVKDLVDECIDLMLNYRQSGHPGGSRSKVHTLLSTMLSGAMRFDLMRPWRAYGDRFVLSAGHTVPLIYATLATLNQIARERAAGGEARFVFPDGGKWALTYEDLVNLRKRDGLPGHAEMAGKSLFLKWNTGPSGHGMPPAAGEAVALKLAGADGVKVFVMEGEGGLTPGASPRNEELGVGAGPVEPGLPRGLERFRDRRQPLLVGRSRRSVDWFAPYGWRVVGTEHGSEWGPVARAVLEGVRGEKPRSRSHDDLGQDPQGARLREVRQQVARNAVADARRGVLGRAQGVHGQVRRHLPWRRPAAPPIRSSATRRRRPTLEIAFSILKTRTDVVETVGRRLAEAADSVPERIPSVSLGGKSTAIFDDPALFDYRTYPASLYKQPGDKHPTARPFHVGRVGEHLREEAYGRPLFIACSADLADSTNIAGFAKDFEGEKGWGWYERDTNPRGTLLPQQITEFTNAGLMVGLASVNLSDDPMHRFDGFWGACSTYGSFSYLKYGSMRLFSQLAQDCELKVGKVLWVAGHSGPETPRIHGRTSGSSRPTSPSCFPKGS
jgi:transketolase